MIISRTPLRMSLVGGGTDLKAFYSRHGGAVVSTAINKYIYVAVHKEFGDRIRIAYSRVEHPATVDDIKHPLVRESLKMLNIKGGIEIMSMADIPSTGTGLGSSSSFTVGLLNALLTFKNIAVWPQALAEDACFIEIDHCHSPIGKQDQYAAAYGGFNYISFNKDGSVDVKPIKCKPETLSTIERRTLLFYTGKTRKSWTVLRKQNDACTQRSKTNTLLRMLERADEMKAALEDDNLNNYANILHNNWLLKKSLTRRISSDAIDRWYDLAIRAGAEGGKLLGAGNGGFLMFYAKEEFHESITLALQLRRIDFRFEPLGSRIVYC